MAQQHHDEDERIDRAISEPLERIEPAGSAEDAEDVAEAWEDEPPMEGPAPTG